MEVFSYVVDLNIKKTESHTTCYNSMPLIWLKLQHDWRVDLVKDFFEKINFPPMRVLQFLAGHVTFKLRCNQI